MDFSSLISKEIDRKRKKSRAKETKRTKLADAAEPIVEDESQKDEQALLLEVNDDKLQQALTIFEGHDAELSKADQLRKLNLLVQKEKKDAAYKAYLDEESAVTIVISKDDIAHTSDDKVFWKLSLQIRKFLKEVLQLWSNNPKIVKDLEHLIPETKRDIVKLLYKLRSRKLPSDMLVSLATIVYYVQTEDMVRASESYMKLSIGNVAWPIGVRDVGIHARAADAKITGDDKLLLANIMKSEATRRWIIAVKRLINYCEALNKSGEKDQPHTSKEH